jgi:hypothetical protein
LNYQDCIDKCTQILTTDFTIKVSYKVASRYWDEEEKCWYDDSNSVKSVLSNDDCYEQLDDLWSNPLNTEFRVFSFSEIVPHTSYHCKATAQGFMQYTGTGSDSALIPNECVNTIYFDTPAELNKAIADYKDNQ